MLGISNFKNIVTGDIAIDLGTANTLIWIKGQGIILNEPSIVARNVVNGDIIAVGNEAMEMVGRTHSGIETLRPLKDGVIADYKMTDAMILGFIRKIKLSRIARPRIVICIPSGVTDVEQRSVKESAEHANASEVYLIEEPMAAAIGIGIDVSKPVGNMIVDVGGGTTEIAVISLNGIGTIETIRIAGDEQTKAIIDWFKEQHKLGIGERTAEDIKCTVGSAVRSSGTTIAVKGQDLITGIPKTMEVSSDEVRQALAETVFQITTAIKNALDKTPPEHSSDIIDFGIILTGGGALLKDLDIHIRSKTNLPVNVSEDPLLSVVKGTGIVLRKFEKIQRCSHPTLMPRLRVPFINKDVLALLLTLFLSAIFLLTRTSPQIRELKFQLSNIASTIAYPTTWYKKVFSIREENKLLKEQLVQFTLMNSELESYHQENKRLKEMLNFTENQPLNFLTANVVGHNFGLPTQSIIIDIGSKDGVANNLTVMDENGLLGKTIKIEDHAALTQLITDKNFRVSVRIGQDHALGLFIPTHGKYGLLEGVRKSMPLNKGEVCIYIRYFRNLSTEYSRCPSSFNPS